MYIRTAMTTLNHKWLATAIVPSDIIDQVMLEDYAADDAMVGKGSNWGNVSVQELPTFADSQDATPETASEIEADLDEDANQDGDTITYSSQEEEIFYQLFYELDYHSMHQAIWRITLTLCQTAGATSTSTRPVWMTTAPTSRPSTAIRCWRWTPTMACCWFGSNLAHPAA